MSKGARQREMAEKIKYQIKRNAAGRRERNQMSLENAMISDNGRSTFVFEIESNLSGGISATSITGVPQQETTSVNEHTLDIHSSDHTREQTLGCKPQTVPEKLSPQLRTVFGTLTHSMGDHMCSTLFSQDVDYEVDFIMKYLDYVFPSLFPFYQPAIFETGRSWLLSLLRHSKIAFHSALSLTSYFFTIALTDAYGDAYADCTGELWTRLQTQTDNCFEIIHTSMLNFNHGDKIATIFEKVHVMESIVQVLIFEVVLGRSVDWNVHLTPALVLFEEVLSKQDSNTSRIISVLHSIGIPSWYKAEYNHYIWNPDQAGFRFFATLLIFIDVIASTALAQPPRLMPYYSDLLAEQDDGAPILGFNRLRLSTTVGCRNSVISAIGQISTLDAWKRTARRTGSFSMFRLVERSAPILMALKATVGQLDADAALQRPPAPIDLPFQSFAVRSNASSSCATTTRIWIQAAQVYLDVVVYGWQTSNIEIHNSISCILELLDAVPSNQLRTLAWPLCVAGCLASNDQEERFREIFATKRKLELIGSLHEAQRVMESVWESRARLDTENWDLAACFSILEKPVLLI